MKKLCDMQIAVLVFVKFVEFVAVFTDHEFHDASEPQPKKSHRRDAGREKKCSVGFQPAKVVLTQKELSRLRCRRDAGATIFFHDLCLRGERGRLAACQGD